MAKKSFDIVWFLLLLTLKSSHSLTFGSTESTSQSASHNYEDTYTCGSEPTSNRILVLSTQNKYWSPELLYDPQGKVQVQNHQTKQTLNKIHGFQVIQTGKSEGQCVTLFELPLMFDNGDVLDSALQLRKRCFDYALMVFDWEKWTETKDSEEFEILLAFVSLMNSVYENNEFLDSVRVLIFKSDSTANSQIISQVNAELKSVFGSNVPQVEVMSSSSKKSFLSFATSGTGIKCKGKCGGFHEGQSTWLGYPTAMKVDQNSKNVKVTCYSNKKLEGISLEAGDDWDAEKVSVSQVTTKVIGSIKATTFTVDHPVKYVGLDVHCVDNDGISSVSPLRFVDHSSSKNWNEWSKWEPCNVVKDPSKRTRTSSDSSVVQEQIKYCRCQDLEELPHPRIVLLGKTGVGKSTLGNQLLGGRGTFKVGHGTDSQTTDISWRADHYLGTGICITVIDTPGIKDSEGRDYEHTLNMQKTLKNKIKSVDIFLLLFKGDDLRFDSTTIELLKWYEAIFGTDMWKHVVMETTYWGHTLIEANKRKSTKGDLDEEKRQNSWLEEIREPPLKVSKDLNIPVLFIDPVVDVFEDPCYYKYTKPTDRETEKFSEFTERFEEYFSEIPPFDCTERCQAPPAFFSGTPWLARPKDKNVLVKHKEAFSEAQIEFQIWTGAAVEESKLAHTIEINERAIKGTSGTTDYLQYKIVVTDIANKYKVIKVSLKYDEEPANAFREWKIVAKNLQGESDPVIVKPTKEAFLSKWTEWSSCSISCLASDDVNAQMGERSKSRECTPGINSKKTCAQLVGHTSTMDYAYETCAGDGDNTKYCPKDYSWGSWLPWSKCFPECGSDSKKIRQRNCLPPVAGGAPCPKDFDTETQKCFVGECPKDCEVGEWGSWSSCTATCWSSGTTPRKSRTRTLTEGNSQGVSCSIFSKTQNENCNKPPCPIDGKWSSWAAWSSCSKTCGGGTQSRSRYCYGRNDLGRDCSGDSTQNQDCNSQDCPCEWNSWGEWGTCDKSCGIGSQKRSRFGTSTCDQEDAVEGKACFNKACTTERLKVDYIYVKLYDSSEAGTDSSTSISLYQGSNSCNTYTLDTSANDWARGSSANWYVTSKTYNGHYCKSSSSCGYHGESYPWCYTSGSWDYCNPCNGFRISAGKDLPRSIDVEFKTGDDDIRVERVSVYFKYPTWIGTAPSYSRDSVGWTEDKGSGNRKRTTAYLNDAGRYCCEKIKVEVETSNAKLKKHAGIYTMTSKGTSDWVYRHVGRSIEIYKKHGKIRIGRNHNNNNYYFEKPSDWDCFADSNYHSHLGWKARRSFSGTYKIKAYCQ